MWNESKYEKIVNTIKDLEKVKALGGLTRQQNKHLSHLSALKEACDSVENKIYYYPSIDAYCGHCYYSGRVEIAKTLKAALALFVDGGELRDIKQDTIHQAIEIANPPIDRISYLPTDNPHVMVDVIKPAIKPIEIDVEQHPIDILIESVAGGDGDKANHLRHLIIYKYLNPTDHQIPALLIQDLGATGKGLLFGRVLSTIWGERHLRLPNIAALTNRFNDILAGKSIVYIDEVEDSCYKTSNHLKAIIGNPTITIEAKGVSRHTVDNIGWFVMSGNQVGNLKLDGAAADRRYSVFLSDSDKTLIDYIGGCDYSSIDQFIEDLVDLEKIAGWLGHHIANPDYQTRPKAYHGDDYQRTVAAGRNQHELFVDFLIDQILAGEIHPDRNGVIGLKLLKKQYLEYIDSSRPADWMKAKRWVVEAINRHKAFLASETPIKHNGKSVRGVVLLMGLAELRETYGDPVVIDITPQIEAKRVTPSSGKTSPKTKYASLRGSDDTWFGDEGVSL